MASGIVVRTIAPLLKDKKSDPAVVVLDETGRFAVSLVSGHIGGANERACEIAAYLGGEAVITTASDVNKLPAIDLWALEQQFVIDDWALLPRLGTKLIEQGKLRVYSDMRVTLPPEFLLTEDIGSADLLVTNRLALPGGDGLYVRPKNIVAGVGCNRNTPSAEIEEAVKRALINHNLSFRSLAGIATIDIKAKEPGIIRFCEQYGLPLVSFSPNELNGVPGVLRSDAAFRATGAKAVAEPSALLATGAQGLLVGKQKMGNVTVAVAEITKGDDTVKTTARKKAGRIFVVGTGPGHHEHITPAAREAIREADVVVGYGTYIELITDMLEGKKVYSTGMTQEIDRCQKAVDLALDGSSVAVISGGDPGIYAMAGLVFEVLRQRNGATSLPEVEVIPGISALNAAAARLGAPLMHDFASISLSDRLTEWETIEKRLDAAAMADFVIVLYNPKSKGRKEQISRAREIIMKYRSVDTPVGIVRGAMRDHETVTVTNLDGMLEEEIDMQTSVVIGNSNTFAWQGRMITPRGYEKKKQFSP